MRCMQPILITKMLIYKSNVNLGPVYMGKNTSPARPGADKRGKFQ